MSQMTSRSEPGAKRRNGALLPRLKWYLNRARAMGAAEIGHRIAEQIKRRSAARRTYGWDSFNTGAGVLPRLPMEPDASGLDARLTTDWRNSAETAQAQGLTLLGQHWPVDLKSQWHWDPASKRTWPRDKYCFNINHRGLQGFGDVKYVWELNRLQHLQPVAALAYAHGSQDDTDWCLEQLESWIDANPPFDGINWSSGIELALRAISIATVLSFVSDAVDGRLATKIRSCLAAHAYWLQRYPSRHSSANNHLIAEAAGLYVIGTLLPDLRHAAQYAEEGARILVQEVGRQIHADGVGAEQSPTYAAFTLELYLLCLWLGDKTGRPFPEAVRARLERAAEHLFWITDRDGNQPRIGDDDEGRVFVSSPEREERYVTSVLGCLSAFLDRPDLAPPDVRPHLRNLLFGMPASPPGAADGVRSFDAGGYTVVRQRVSGRNALLVMDHGPLGHLSIAAHGHADALALWLHLDGQPILVDAGTYLYHSGREWRDHFRSTAAHNTLSVGGESSSTISGPFNWSHKARAWREVALASNGASRIAAHHDGYMRRFGVTHRREIVVEEDRIRIHDSLLGKTSDLPPVRIGFLFHPGLDVEIRDNTAVISRDATPLAVLTPDAKLELSVHHGETSPPLGWYSARFGERQPAPLVLLKTSGGTGGSRWTTDLLISPN